MVKHKIDTAEAWPISKAPYRPHIIWKMWWMNTEDMLKKMNDHTSNSLRSSPGILVPKWSNEWTQKICCCINFRALYQVTKFDSYPLPHIEDAIAAMAGTNIFQFYVVMPGLGKWTLERKMRRKQHLCSKLPLGHCESNCACSFWPFCVSNQFSAFIGQCSFRTQELSVFVLLMMDLSVQLQSLGEVQSAALIQDILVIVATRGSHK